MFRRLARTGSPLPLAALLVGCGTLGVSGDLPPPDDDAWAAPPRGDAPPVEDPSHWDRDAAESALDATWYGDVLVANDAVVLDALPCFDGFVRDPASSAVQLRFSCDASASGLREGSVLVSGRADGLLVRAEQVTFTAAGATVLASPARLTDVVYTALVAERIPLTMEPGDLPAGPMRDASTFDFSGTPLFSVSGGAGSASARIETGVVTLDPGMDFGVNIDWFDWNRPWPKLEKANLGVTLDGTLDLVVAAEAEGAFDRSGERDLFAFDKPFAFQIGPVPVAGAVSFDVDLVWSVSASGAADGRVGTSIASTVGLGGKYDDGDWQNTSGFEWTDTLIGPELTVEGTADVRAAIRVRATVGLYGAVAVDGQAEPWAAAHAELSCGNVDWDVDVGIDLTSSVGYDVLGFSGSWDFPDFHWDKQLAEGSLPVYDAAIDPSCGDDGPVDEPVVVDDSGDESGGGDLPDDVGDLEDGLANEHCWDGVDNDDDGYVDCADHSCADSLACGSECVVWDNISCGDVITADTRGVVDGVDSRIAGYPVNPGLYSGPEAAFAFTSPVSNTVRFRLVDPTPVAVDHDVMVLHTPTGVCAAEHAVAWGPNLAEFEVVRGERYIIVIDGYDGDAGEFTLEVDCRR